ncbi:MAG: PorT family protein [Chitinophagaceae bacterium]|nr:PorT family protein [Chitinophagaceae bacterium]
MKKLLLVLTALLFVLFTSNAQKLGIEYGIKLGPNFSTWTGEDAEPSFDEEKKMKIGLHGGAFMIIPLTTILNLQPELLFSSEGVKYEFDDGAKATAITSHLNVPILIRLQTKSGFYAIIGPQIGFTLGGKAKYEDDGDEEKEDIEDLRGVVFSGLVGAGFRTKSGFGIYARFAKAFSSVFDYGDDYDDKTFNSTIALSFFYMLKMTGKK